MRLRKISLLVMTMCLLSACSNSEPTSTISTENETETIVQVNNTEEVSETEEIQETESEIIEAESTLVESTGIEIVEVMDVRMYVVKEEIIRAGDSTDFKMINTLMKGGSARVTGKTTNGWYEIDCVTVKGYVPADSLSITNPNPSTEELTEEEKQWREETSAMIKEFMEQSEKDKENAHTNPGTGQGTWNGGEAPDGSW